MSFGLTSNASWNHCSDTYLWLSVGESTYFTAWVSLGIKALVQRQYYSDECLDWLLNTVLIYMVLTGIMQKDILVNKHKYKKNNLALFPFFPPQTDWSSVFSGLLRFFLKLSQTCWERDRLNMAWNNPNTSLTLWFKKGQEEQKQFCFAQL